MSHSLTNFLATATLKAANDLKAAVERVPADKRDWKPMDKGRSALDQAAEVAMLNGASVDMIQKRKWNDDFDFAGYEQEKAELQKDWNKVQQLLDANTARVIEAIKAVPESDLDVTVQMPWGPMQLSQIIAYPYWNASYHEGQINYIASMLGTL